MQFNQGVPCPRCELQSKQGTLPVSSTHAGWTRSQPCALGRHWIARAAGRCSTWKCCVFHLRPLMWDTVSRSASSSCPSACEPGDDEL